VNIGVLGQPWVRGSEAYVKTVLMSRPAVQVRSVYLLLALAVGALMAAGWFLLTVSAPTRAGGVASAQVLSTASCASGGLDTVRVASPAGPVTTALDGCGRPVGSALLVDLAADGSVPNPAALAGTRTGSGRSALPPVVLGVSAALTIGLGVGSLRASSARAPRPHQG